MYVYIYIDRYIDGQIDRQIDRYRQKDIIQIYMYMYILKVLSPNMVTPPNAHYTYVSIDYQRKNVLIKQNFLNQFPPYTNQSVKCPSYSSAQFVPILSNLEKLTN